MKVYRFERLGLGPYCRGMRISSRTHEEIEFMNRILWEHQDEDHPSMKEDFEEDEITGNSLCACDTIEKLYQWFDGFIDELFKFGYKIFEYDVLTLEYGFSDKQVIFDRSDVLSRQVYNPT